MQASSSVRCIAGRHRAFCDELVHDVPAFRIVDAVGVRQEAQTVCKGLYFSKRVSSASSVPTQRTGRLTAKDDAAAPAFAKHLVEAMHSPDCEQICNTSPVNPDDILR